MTANNISFELSPVQTRLLQAAVSHYIQHNVSVNNHLYDDHMNILELIMDARAVKV